MLIQHFRFLQFIVLELFADDQDFLNDPRICENFQIAVLTNYIFSLCLSLSLGALPNDRSMAQVLPYQTVIRLRSNSFHYSSQSDRPPYGSIHIITLYRAYHHLPQGRSLACNLHTQSLLGTSTLIAQPSALRQVICMQSTHRTHIRPSIPSSNVTFSNS